MLKMKYLDLTLFTENVHYRNIMSVLQRFFLW